MNGHAATLHRQAIVIDAHCDMLMAIADRKMRLADRIEAPPPATWQPLLGYAINEENIPFDFSPHTDYFQAMGHYDLSRLIDGGVTALACAIYIDGKYLDRPLHRALEMVSWLRREVADHPELELITGVSDIHRVKERDGVGLLLTFEGFEPLESDLKLLDVFHDLGLRMASLTHSRRNSFADGIQMGVKSGGLSALGQAAIARMNRLGIVIDLAHLNVSGRWEVIERSEAPVVLSHTSPRRTFPVDPTSSPLYPDIVDERSRPLLDAIAETGGVVGVIAYDQPSLAAMVEDVDYLIQAVGPDHVGLGTDFFGVEHAPDDFVTIADLARVTAALVERGYSDEFIRKLLGGNFLRVFEQIWH